ncbi:snoRNA-binding rRNA-processing protein UTP10 Ecym_6361 [Eremothecium cymbalariae DBVPG|uniref:U3 small nucleolar RNA-associated protein 10 n=1 Tax=Eremothecium cymbalariae (strain CBS 270.75 / DBVPG 7215 / KCTC 17166 / NRRL Y-17582) TaxID=931890 RepID=G8JUF7_ERECY|nr:hypothetical protein Ecym_6361 [Eremothecium cymbalariae DBVPG\
MSSLRDQLAQVAASNSTVALDRKRRQKLHSTSLLYNPKTAATQDYDTIFENASAALEELIHIEPRFKVFCKSLFNASSVSIDRNVQTKDQIQKLDNAVNAYLMLASSRWHLTPTLHATEWLVRRFQIHIHNAEMLLFSTLNYYQSPVFKRILNIVKLPPLFNAFSNFIKTEKVPSNLTIIRLFNDFEFLRLYTNHLSKTVKQKVTYTNQLLFTSCSFINLIAFNSDNEERLNELVPILLEISAKLMASESDDCQTAAYTVMVVLATALPLKKEIILAALETILTNLSENASTKRCALTAIFKLFQTSKGQNSVDHLPSNLFKLFDAKFSLNVFVDSLSKHDTQADKFATAYVRSIARYDHEKLNLIISILKKIDLEKFEMRLIITDLIHLSELLQEMSQLVELFEYFVSIDEDMVLRCLKSLNLTSELFEIRLTTSIFSVEKTEQKKPDEMIKELEAANVLGVNNVVQPFKEFLNKNSEHLCTKSVSMFVQDDQKFSKLVSLFVEAVGKKYQPGLFLSSFFTTLESRITFLLRVIASPSAPIALRLVSLSNLSKLINSIGNDSNLFTLIPILIVALTDVSKNVRIATKKILHQISKRPFTKRYFLSEKIYGEGLSVPILNPKDSEWWLNRFLEGYMVENYDISSLLIPKKNEKIYLLFWANQALFIPLPLPKLILMRYIGTHESYSSTYSQIFEKFLPKYIQERSQWEKMCSLNKTNFKDFESALVSMVAMKEKNQSVIDFVIDSLKSPYEQLASLMAKRIINIYPTLKQGIQLHLVQNIIETTAESELFYDSIETLQELPLTSDIFVSILNQNTINHDGTHEPSKRRRRSSAANKVALQKEQISHIAEIHLRKLTIILEALDKMKVGGSEILLSTLLNILSDLETLDQDGGLPVLYAQETLASCMLNVIESLNSNGSRTTMLKSVRADILVAVLRASPSPQLQNKLLLVAGSLAVLNPEVVLHSIMPIFTFMGAQSIRQDDEFSTMVVEKTIKSVVPALLTSGSSELSDEIEFLLMSFSTAFSHVPKHRRVRLFTTLIKTLGSSSAVHSFLLLMAQQYSNNISRFNIADAKSILEFCKALLSKFDVLEQLHGIAGFLELVDLLGTHHKDNAEILSRRTLFSNGILNYSEVELHAFEKNAFDFIDKIITEDGTEYHSTAGNLKLRILSSFLDVERNEEFNGSIKVRFGDVLKLTLGFINNAEKLFNISANSSANTTSDIEDSNSEPEVDDAVEEVKEILFKLLGHILDLLPINPFVESVLTLIQSTNDGAVRHHIIMVTNSKFKLEPVSSSVIAERVINQLFGIVSNPEEATNIVQVSLNTLSSLITKFGEKIDSKLLVESLKVGSQLLISKKIEVIISGLAVLTSTIYVLGVKSIAFYPKIVPQALEIFESVKDSNDELREQLQLSVILLFASMLKRIPSFLQSNLADVLRVVLFADGVQESIRLYVTTLIVEHIDLKEVLKNLYKLWSTEASQTNDSVAVSLFLSSLEATVEAIDKKSATSQSPIFFKLLLSLFEYRSISTFDNNTISRIEASVHQIANSYVLKLNDKIFRPLFALTVRWAFDGENVANSQVSKNERLIAFFKFYNKLQENLKSIVTSYFTYLLEPTAILLQNFTTGKISDVSLRRLVLISLTSSFKYDRDEYWKTSSRFELISETLTSQLSNIEDVIGKYLVKAIGALASNNSGVDEHNKIMHRLLISHMKSSCQSKEKLWTVKSTKLIYSKVGEGWLVLLPQLVPIIAELLEDDNEEVEREVRVGLVKVVENVLGEPFDRYLN